MSSECDQNIDIGRHHNKPIIMFNQCAYSGNMEGTNGSQHGISLYSLRKSSLKKMEKVNEKNGKAEGVA